MPFFKANRKNRDLLSLEQNPQNNLASIRSILRFSVRDIEQKLEKIECAYFGVCKQDQLKMLTSWANGLRKVMESSHATVISSSDQMDDLMKKVSDPAHRFGVDAFEVNRVKEVYRRTLDTVPHKFQSLVKDIESVVLKTAMYCLSFYDMDEHELHYLDTGFNYETQIRTIRDTIKENVNNITNSVGKFKSGAFITSDLSPEVKELARKANCLHAPFLLLVPAAVQNIHCACAALVTWIKTDESYSVFITHDVAELEGRKKELEKAAQARHEKYHHLLFRLKHLQCECEKLSTDLHRLSDRDSELIVEEEFLINQSNDMQVEIENKEYRRDELIKNASNIHPEVMFEKYSELCEELRDLKSRLPVTKRRLNAVQYKIAWIREKKKELDVEEKKLHEVEKEMKELTDAKTEEEVEQKHVTTLLEKARKIHSLKASPDVVQKIFHGMPVTTNKSRLPGQCSKNDPFEKACQVVAQHIEGDGGRLYRSLPFFPYRGSSMVDEDIRVVTAAASRKTSQQVSLLLLDRWRRHHTRARIEDLKQTLKKIHRNDVIAIINHQLHPPRPPTPTEEVIPDFLDESLIPYWKEIEKYDQLKAAKKITV
ncbi:hypothetical protein CAPTEDRAFT_193238 [Capitella teleta]|uniref:Death domain-containing protein n=1 Tax=Capitella teleta TaxID=283909 RepID=R7UHV1_CAPTE|nr:hypothetical protein CAPTEDRAFT_193238 [Capitella teleta]|eukprot:ELU05790.1 hypothetical protein CAPTEDRAFT_193238 [Capitella teleta]